MARSTSPSPRRERSLSPAGRGGDDRRSRSRSRSGHRNDGPKRMRGTAARWNEKGFGFIKPEDPSQNDVFCHFTSIQDGNCLHEGDTVEFEIRFDEAKGKDRAENVTGGRTEDRRVGGRSGGECYDYKQGRCHRGDSCKFSHDGGDRGRSRDRYDDRRYDDRRSRDRYDDRRRDDRYDDRRGRDRY
ncbi:hypothetical protein SPRG_05885 [Saprolegnia parasitica CBS 223.65]|uniref:C3H1-type domain-containing protein n=1 Tax=Saprolegnia parasitica (strain CBS 223.65) TaxID=695850 RepID=A0A067CF18_SAPPC|nr:hypothetical protein SPRG_05885 [Saprolegnia parasitica CBS 223.65]KDO29349.1 hypothetical protein SPRG_05885 [Saprolegnia parasitica CBS 223.65]|eukprot:XP_012199852.1 hypothetical protein SPRG_05885 [Saprolegnia parasitica CBS 223.65]